MHEEFENFERNHVLELVDPPPISKHIGTRWVWKKHRGREWRSCEKQNEVGYLGF
jgi:hypothetical protein